MFEPLDNTGQPLNLKYSIKQMYYYNWCICNTGRYEATWRLPYSHLSTRGFYTSRRLLPSTIGRLTQKFIKFMHKTKAGTFSCWNLEQFKGFVWEEERWGCIIRFIWRRGGMYYYTVYLNCEGVLICLLFVLIGVVCILLRQMGVQCPCYIILTFVLCSVAQ